MLIKQGETNIKHLLIVIVLAIIVGGEAFWLINKQKIQPIETKIPESEIADWKIYKTENNEWEIKYPKDWMVKVGKAIVYFYPEGKSPQIFVVSHTLTLEEETKCNPSFLKQIGLRIVGQEIINDTKFCKIFVESEGEILQTYYNVTKNDNEIGDVGDTVYDIGFNYSDEGKLIILRQMLSTFKSLK